MSQKELTTNQIILAYFIFQSCSLILSFVWRWGINLDSRLLALNPVKDHMFSVGYAFKIYYVFMLIPTLMILWVVQKELKLHYSFFSFHKIVMSCLIALIIYLVGSIAVFGLHSSFWFFGYNFHFNSTILLYSSIALFVVYILRDKGTVQTLLFASLATFIVSEFWELPLQLSLYEKVNVPTFLIGYINNDLPLLLWFYIFKDTYINFLRERWYLAVVLVSAIFILTFGDLQPSSVGWGWEYGLVMRLSYALLLVFMPFALKKRGRI